jgi:carbohydrate kinase (thermoresistant glucokinase family)
VTALGNRPPSVIVVMGVSGSGKTTIGALLAGMLHWQFADGDDFHPSENLRKMKSGVPLTDEDRLPWLRAIASWISEMRDSGRHGVIACSALKRSYRALLSGGHDDVRLVYLRGDADLIARRMAARHEHFMPVALLKSQLDALEEPGPEEHALTVSIAAPPLEIASRIIAKLRLDPLRSTSP